MADLPGALGSRALLRFRLIQTQEAGGVVVEDVALLFRREVVGVLDNADGDGHQSRPDELVGAEHDAIFEAGFYDALDVAIDFLDWVAPDQTGYVDVDVGVGL